MTLIPATYGSRKSWAHRGETVNFVFSLVQRNERTMNNAPAVLRHEKSIALAAMEQSEKKLSCKQIQNQVANNSRSSSRRCYALRNTLLYVLRFLRSGENISFVVVMPSVQIFAAQDKRAL